MITAQIIADSLSPDGVRLTTMQLQYPRFIHSEFMTHRVFSRNARSSRAVPTSRLLDEVRSKPTLPVYWGKNQAGMQAREELPAALQHKAREVWLDAAYHAAYEAERLSDLGVHKQIVNRIIEPFLDIHTVVTATEWSNFYKLRQHTDAQPEIKALADMMRRFHDEGKPFPLEFGEWHLPYIMNSDQELLTNRPFTDVLKVSVARCARVSYKAFDGTVSPIEKDIELANQLKTNGHWSPFEHQARAIRGTEFTQFSGNFRGFEQYRKMIER